MKTIKVRIAVAVDKNGDWSEIGSSHHCWFTGELPIQSVETIAEDVEKAE
jgi:hypothetical protein